MQPEQPQSDERLEQALDRLGKLVAPESVSDDDFVSRVMCRVRGTPADVRQPSRAGRWLVRAAIGAAACLIATLVLWTTIVARRAPLAVIANDRHEEATTPASQPIESAPVVRTSTWSVVTEGVVLEGDIPVRKLLYREFERVEVLDSQGNPESSLVVPTKAMLVASEERY